MSDYTPTTEEVRAAASRAIGSDWFDRWMVAHDAQKRAEWEAEQGELEWEIGYQLIDQWGNSVGVGWPFPTVEEAAEQGERRASEETARDPRLPTWSRVARRRKAGPWLPVEENKPHTEGNER